MPPPILTTPSATTKPSSKTLPPPAPSSRSSGHIRNGATFQTTPPPAKSAPKKSFSKFNNPKGNNASAPISNIESHLDIDDIQGTMKERSKASIADALRSGGWGRDEENGNGSGSTSRSGSIKGEIQSGGTSSGEGSGGGSWMGSIRGLAGGNKKVSTKQIQWSGKESVETTHDTEEFDEEGYKDMSGNDHLWKAHKERKRK